MDARSNNESRLPSRQMAASDGSPYVALHALAIAHQHGIAFDFAKFDRAEIFKKTPCAADSKPGGRDVAKDIYDLAGIPLLMKTLRHNGYLRGDWLVRDADTEIDADVGALNVKLTGAELSERKTKWMPRATNPTSGVLWTVGPGVDGAVAHLGAAYEKQCYADI